MSRIRVLPPHIANKIAAGEVVERPASVAKELLENALDAGASRIRVELEDGGKRLIRVVDDGCGMTREELGLAVERHATSKIRDVSDLETLRTLGFRGEALPSIGAVSRLSLVSRPAESLEGWKLRVAFGQESNLTAVGCPPGTTVDVEDLFLEIPARRRFLKTRQTELGHVVHLVRTLSVGHPGIVFELYSDGRELFRSRSGLDHPKGLWPLLGEKLVDRLFAVTGRGDQMELEGYVAPPGEARSTWKALHFFLNRRHIQSRLLQRAVADGFRGFLMRRVFPVGVLFLHVDPGRVDVNIHPTKQEVRFLDSDAVYRMVYHGVKRALQGVKEAAPATPLRPQAGDIHRQEQLSISSGESRVSEVLPPSWEDVSPVDRIPQGSAGRRFKRDAFDAPGPVDGRSESPRQTGPEEEARAGGLRVLGQFARSYIVAEGPDGLVVVDQHAAHEGLVFRRLSQSFQEAGTLTGQPLLFPLVLDRTPEEVAGLADCAAVLSRLGLAVEPFGLSQVVVREVPEFLASGSDAEAVVGDLLDRVLRSPGQDSAAFFHDLLSSMACHTAVRARQTLQVQEMEALLSELAEEGVTHCPHGRPVIQILGLSEIQRRFGRT